MKVSKKSKKRRDIFAFWVSQRAIYKSKVASENQSVAVQNVNCFVVKIHDFILRKCWLEGKGGGMVHSACEELRPGGYYVNKDIK